MSRYKLLISDEEEEPQEDSDLEAPVVTPPTIKVIPPEIVFSRFRGIQDRTYHISLLTDFKYQFGARAHYHREYGIFLCKNTPACCRFGKASPRYAAIISVIGRDYENGGRGLFIPWVFGWRVYNSISNYIVGSTSVDFQVNCDIGAFQRFTVHKKLLRTYSSKDKDMIEEKTKDLVPFLPLLVGKDIPIEELEILPY